MKPTEFLREFDTMEDEQLDGMALGELKAIAQAAEKIYNSVKSGTPLEAWMYKKITNGNEGLTAVAQQINNPEIREPQHNTLESAPDYSDMFEGTIYDMEKEYGAPAAKHKPRPHMAPQRPRHPDDPDFMDPDQRRLRADQARVKKAQDEYHAKKGVAEEETPFGSVSVANTPSNQKPYVEPSRQDIWDKNDLVNRQAEVREQKQLTLRYARKHGRKAMEDIWAKKTDVRMTVEEILEFLDATLTDPGISPEEFMGTRGLDEAIPLDKLRATAGSAQPKTDEKLRQFYADMKAKKQNMAKYANDTADMAKAAIANKMPLSKNQVNEFAGGMGASSVGSAPGVGKGPKVGSLFGGSYAPKTPFNKKRKR